MNCRPVPANAIVAADSGSAANWYARHLKFTAASSAARFRERWPPWARACRMSIGAKWAHPDRPSIAFVGRRGDADERHGRADHHRAVLAAVDRSPADHRDSAQQRPQSGHLGNAGHGRLAEVRGIADTARSRLRRIRAQSGPAWHQHRRPPTALGSAWERALAADRPTVLDVRCDPDVPPIPPHATFEQAKSLVHAVLAATRILAGFIKQGDQAEGAAVSARRERRIEHEVT